MKSMIVILSLAMSSLLSAGASAAPAPRLEIVKPESKAFLNNAEAWLMGDTATTVNMTFASSTQAELTGVIKSGLNNAGIPVPWITARSADFKTGSEPEAKIVVLVNPMGNSNQKRAQTVARFIATTLATQGHSHVRVLTGGVSFGPMSNADASGSPQEIVDVRILTAGN